MVKRMAALAGAIAAVAIASMATPAGAQQYPPADNRVTVSAACPEPGDSITVTARTFTPGANVGVTLTPQDGDAVSLGNAIADGNGVASLDVAVPDVSRGPATLTASGDSLDLSANITVCPFDEPAEQGDAAVPVGPARDGRAEGQLPRTGSDLGPLQIGVALAALGGILMALAAKRRRRAAHLPA